MTNEEQRASSVDELQENLQFIDRKYAKQLIITDVLTGFCAHVEKAIENGTTAEILDYAGPEELVVEALQDGAAVSRISEQLIMQMREQVQRALSAAAARQN